jgi:hypothetical protein
MLNYLGDEKWKELFQKYGCKVSAIIISAKFFSLIFLTSSFFTYHTQFPPANNPETRNAETQKPVTL